MFSNSSCVPFTMPVAPANGGYGNGDGFFGDGGWWVIILFALIFGWGNGGYGFGGGNGNGRLNNDYALITDNATLERKIDGVYSGICDSTFSLNNTITNGFAAAQNTMTQGFAGVNTGLVTQGYETRNAITQDTIANMQGFNGLQAAVKDCCCTTQSNIKDVNYNVATQANGISRQIADCCCDVERQIERGFADTNYAMATQNCATLQAIDKVGDRIIDHLVNDKTQALRDENQALRLAASQQAQNNYLVQQLRPCPSPAYVVPNPYCGCNNGFGYGYGTTIA